MILQSRGLFRLPWVKVWLSVHSSEPPPLQRWLLEVDINKLLKRLSSHEFPAWWAAEPWVCRAFTWPLGWACLGLKVMLGLKCNGKLCMEKVSPTILPHKEWQSCSAWVSDSQEDLREDYRLNTCNPPISSYIRRSGSNEPRLSSWTWTKVQLTSTQSLEQLSHPFNASFAIISQISALMRLSLYLQLSVIVCTLFNYWVCKVKKNTGISVSALLML